MKVLLVKTSSFGDIIHTLPAVNDLFSVFPDVELTWLIEESFVEMPKLNPRISSSIAVAIRRWRKSWFSSFGEISSFRKTLRLTEYDYIIDAQGLMKSAVLAKMARGKVHGLDGQSSKEATTRFLYDETYAVEKNQHAVDRVRQLFSKIFSYDLSDLDFAYGLDKRTSDDLALKPNLMFLHGTTWSSKHWPETRWRKLALLAEQRGFKVTLSYGNKIEQARAERIVKGIDGALILPPSDINQLVSHMLTCRGIVSVDTGLGHLATALDVPLVGIFGPTDPLLTGPRNINAKVLLSDKLDCIPCLRKDCMYEIDTESGRIHPPCFETIDETLVLETLSHLMSKG